MLSLTPLTAWIRAVSSSMMSFASRRERASRSSLATTRVSPFRQAAKASRSPGRARVVDSAGEAVVGVDQVRSNAEGFQSVLLGCEILLVSGHACVSDQEFIHNRNGARRPMETARIRP